MSDSKGLARPRTSDGERRANGDGAALGPPAALPPPGAGRVDDFADLDVSEGEVAAVREAIRERVRRSFRGSLNEQDLEDAIQDAWVAVLKKHRENPIRDVHAFAAEVGWRAARGIARRVRPMLFDPLDSPVLEIEDHSSSPVERIDNRAQFARLTEALEQLDGDKREAFGLRFIERIGHDEACARLGIGRSAYFKRVRAAKARVEAAMGLECHLFERRQRQLLSDYVAGIAVGRARLRAERLIAADPHAAALARELRQSHEAAVLVLPALGLGGVVDEQAAGRIAALADRLQETMSGWLGRSAEAGDLASSPALLSGGARGAGAVGAGLVAKTFGGLSTGNLVLGCLGGGAVATVACVAAGVLPLPGSGDGPAYEGESKVARKAGPPERAAGRVRIAGVVSSEPVAPEPSRPALSKSKPPDPEASAPEPVLEESTPPEVAEFGVEAAAVPSTGAPPDTDDSDGASASTVRQEFGP